jgi:hypothetical protein
MVEDIISEPTSISKDNILVSRIKYNELILDNLKNKLFIDTYKLIKLFNINNYTEVVESKINGCIGILNETQISILSLEFVDCNQRYKSKKRPVKEVKTYLIYEVSSKLYKIGKSVNPENRMKSIQTSGETKLIHVINRDIENKLHRRFKDKRVHNEWFELSDKDVCCIKKMF